MPRPGVWLCAVAFALGPAAAHAAAATPSDTSSCPAATSTGWYRSNPTCTVQGRETGGTINSVSYQLDGTVHTVSGTQATVTVSGDAVHTLSTWVTDKNGISSGSQSSPSRTFTPRVDTTKPADTSRCTTPDGTNGWHVTVPVICTVQGVDATSGVDHVSYQLDSGQIVTTPSGQQAAAVSVVGNQQHTLKTEIFDQAGNGTSWMTTTIKIDTTTPTDMSNCPTSWGAGTAGWYITSSVTCLAQGSDSVSGIESVSYQVDSGPVQTAAGANAPVTVAGDRPHTIITWVTDQAGKSSGSEDAPSGQLGVQIDSQRPADTSSCPKPTGTNGWYVTGAVTCTVSGSGGVSGVASVSYQLDSGPVHTVTGQSTQVTVSGDGTHTLKTWVTSGAGLASGWQAWPSLTVSVPIDSEAPTDSSFCPDPGTQAGVYLSAPTCTVKGADTVSRVDHVDYQADSDAVQSTRSGVTSRDVQITGGGTHTLRERIVDKAGNASGWQTFTVHVDGNYPGTVSLDQSAYKASEHDGSVAVTIVRSDPNGTEWVGYGATNQDAQPGLDFDTVPSTGVEMADGERTLTFQIPVHDLGINGPPVHATVYLYAAHPASLGTSSAPITILRDDPLQARPPTNPLGISPAPTDGDPLRGAHFYVAGSSSPAGQAAQQNPALAPLLSKIAARPYTYRFSRANGPGIAGVTAHFLENWQAKEPGTVALISTYELVHGLCNHGGGSDTRQDVADYRNWIDGLAQGIGNFRAVLFLEMDSLITTPCLSAQGLKVRLVDELHWAVDRLEQDPHLVVYLDGGAADAVPWRKTARMLRRAGVKDAQGFFLNSTHFDWTSTELYYGQRISRALGGVHFVINTGESGRGPLIPADRTREGNEVLCNPPGRGLGPFSTDTHYRWADAFLWTSNPGESGGRCGAGAPPTAAYWPQYGAMLARNATSTITGPACPLLGETGQLVLPHTRAIQRNRPCTIS